MKTKRNIALLVLLSILGTIPAFCQIQEEDVVVLKDGHVFRGAIANKITIGGTISLTGADGKTVVLFWEELAVVRRLPAGIPDSVLVQAFLPPTGRFAGPPRIDLKGYDRAEDVVFTRDGAVRRGVQLNEGLGGWIGLWVDGSYSKFPRSAVMRSVRVDRGIPDSMLIMTHIAPPVAWSEAERRYLTLFGGYAMPMMGEHKVEDVAPRDLDAAPVFGLEVGIRIGRGIRWLTGATYSSHGHGSIASIGAIDGATSEDMKMRIIAVFTGIEVRTIGPSVFQFRGFLQGGMLMLSEKGFNVSFPQTYYHLKGDATADDMSAKAFGIQAGGGIVAGRFTLDVRWIISKPAVTTRTTIVYQYSNPKTLEFTDDRMLNLFMITAGFSPF